MVAGAAYTPQISPRRVVVINPAESMNRNSANSLLKTLEEPPGDTNIILISHTPSMLLPTIRSRCQQIAFPPPSSAEAAQWLQEQGVSAEEVAEVLQLAEGAPLHALTLASSDQREHNKLMGEELNALQRGQANPIKVAYRWANKKNDPVLTLRWLQQRVVSIIKTAYKVESPASQQLFLFLDKVNESLSLANSPLNKELMFETLLLDWSKLRS
jgi:DNA polymerase-3 subunit delta'